MAFNEGINRDHVPSVGLDIARAKRCNLFIDDLLLLRGQIHLLLQCFALGLNLLVHLMDKLFHIGIFINLHLLHKGHKLLNLHVVSDVKLVHHLGALQHDELLHDLLVWRGHVLLFQSEFTL